MKLQDYIHYYWHCKMQFRPQHNSEYLFYGFIKELPINGTEVLMHVIEDNIGETPDNNVCYAFCPDIKPILRLVEDMTDDDIKLFFEYEKLTRLYRDVSFNRFIGGITVNYSVDTEDEGWHPQSHDFHFKELSSLQLHRLLKSGFDMFSLIKNGLAIDAKTLK